MMQNGILRVGLDILTIPRDVNLGISLFLLFPPFHLPSDGLLHPLSPILFLSAYFIVFVSFHL